MRPPVFYAWFLAGGHADPPLRSKGNVCAVSRRFFGKPQNDSFLLLRKTCAVVATTNPRSYLTPGLL